MKELYFLSFISQSVKNPSNQFMYRIGTELYTVTHYREMYEGAIFPPALP